MFPEIQFSLPEGVTDTTVYSFVAEGKDFRLQEDLMFGRDRLPDGVRDLDGLVKNRLDEFRAITPDQIQVVEDAPARFGPAVARRLDVREQYDGKPMRTLYLFAALSDGTYLQLTYKVAPGDKEAVQRLDYIAGSVRPRGQAAGEARQGFTRRSAGAMTLEVPYRLRPPSRYSFAFQGGPGSLDLDIWRLGEPNPPLPLTMLMSRDAALAERAETGTSQTVQLPSGPADVLHYTLATRDLDKVIETAVARARIQFTSGSIALVTARSPVSFRAQMEARFAAFLQTLREE
ncbi:MAG TPA: hypothetical protein VLY04_01050 [Bryobacteraceae bacterium]|nr:hypothetical protein [Bryobacteraceae bacterium]